MARGELLDIMALYAYDNTVFNNLKVPTTITYKENGESYTENLPYTSQDIIDNICLECAELEVLYPDADYMKLAIGVWSNKRLYTWQRIADVLYRKYDPFINIRRDEERITTEERDLAKSEDRDLAMGETRDLAGTNDVTGRNNVNAYDDSSATGVQRGQVITDQDTTDTGTIDKTDTGTIDWTDTGTVTTTETFHVEGDSAITDAQDVLVKEVQARLAHDLIDIICQDFKDRFCLTVY